MLKNSHKNGFFALYIITFVAILTGTFLRIFYLKTPAPTNDELWAIYISNADTLHNIIERMKEIQTPAIDLNPPLYYFFMHTWIKYFGLSTLSIRIPSAFFSCLVMLFTYRLTKKLTNSSVTAKISVILISLSFGLIYYSNYARCYTLLVLLVIFFLYSRFHTTQRESKSGYVTHGVFSILLANIHFFGTIYVLSSFMENIIFFFKEKLSSKKNNNSFLKLAMVEATGLLVCATYIILYLKFFLAFIPDSVDGQKFLSMKNSPSLHEFINEFFFLFDLNTFFILFTLIVGSYFFFISQPKENEKTLNIKFIFRNSGLITSAVTFFVASLISVYIIPILLAKNLLIALPSLVILFSVLLSIPVGNKGYNLFFTFFISVFVYLSATSGLSAVNSTHREVTNYNFFKNDIGNLDAVFSGAPMLLKTYMQVMGDTIGQFHGQIYHYNQIQNELPLRNLKNIMIFESVIPQSEIEKSLKTTLENKYNCKSYCTNCSEVGNPTIIFFVANCSKKN